MDAADFGGPEKTWSSLPAAAGAVKRSAGGRRISRLSDAVVMSGCRHRHYAWQDPSGRLGCATEESPSSARGTCADPLDFAIPGTAFPGRAGETKAETTIVEFQSFRVVVAISTGSLRLGLFFF